MADPFLAEVRIFAGNFAPRGYAFCDGQMLAINQNQALFSLIGTTYGGNGRTDFGLPDLRNRVPIHVGTGRGLPEVKQGEKGPALSLATKKPTGPASLAANYIIALRGTFPSRS